VRYSSMTAGYMKPPLVFRMAVEMELGRACSPPQARSGLKSKPKFPC